MPSTAGTLGLGLSLPGLWESWGELWETTPGNNWLALQYYLLPLISFVCVGLEGWCFFDLFMRKTLGARSAAAAKTKALAAARDASLNLDLDLGEDLDYDVVKDFPNGGFEPSNNQLCIHGLLGIKLQPRHVAYLTNPTNTNTNTNPQPKIKNGNLNLTVPCDCLITAKGTPNPRKRRRREMSYITI